MGSAAKAQRTWPILITIYIVALLTRLALVYTFAWDFGIHYEFAGVARHILSGQGYVDNWYGQIPTQPTAIVTPGYTFLLVLIMAIFGDSARWIYIIQSAISALVVFAAFWLGKYVAGMSNGLVAAGLFAVFPEIAFLSTKMIAETVAIVPIILAIYLYLKYKSDMIAGKGTKRFFLMGVFLGITTLTKASTVFLFLAFCFGLILTSFRRKALFSAVLLIGLGFAVAVSPWIIRNVIVMHRPVLRTGFGFNLWRGNHPWGSGTGWLGSGVYSEHLLDPEYKAYIEANRPDSELALNDFYFREAIRFIKAEPIGYFQFTLRRALYFLTIDPTHPLTFTFVNIGGYIFVVIFGIWGGIMLSKRGRFDSIFVLAPLVYMMFYAPVIMLPRYRMMLLWMLLALSSVSITALLQRTRLRKVLGA